MRRWFRGGGSGVAPPSRSVAALAGAVMALAGVTLVAYAWLRRPGEPARVLAGAAALLDDPVRLEQARDALWEMALDAAAHAPGGGLETALTPLPPPLCAPSGDLNGLNAAIRALEGAMASPARAVLEGTVERLAGLALFPGSDAAWIREYALARGTLAAGRSAAAWELLSREASARDRVPVVGPSGARGLLDDGAVRRDDAAVAYHARLLAGLAAIRSGRPEAAIPPLRFAVNALNYLEPSPGSGTEAARLRGLPVDPGRFTCPFSGVKAADSRTAYVALVGAYLAAESFSDPSRLPAELNRTRTRRPGPEDTDGPERILDRPDALPEHLLWAASNLENLGRHDPDGRDGSLFLARAILALRMTDPGQTAWPAEESCRLMFGAGGGDPSTAPPIRLAPPEDTAAAGATLRTLGRVGQVCGLHVPLSGLVPDRLLEKGGHALAGGLPARYLTLTISLEGALASGEAAGPAEFEPLLAAWSSDRAHLAAGRWPPGGGGSGDPGRVGRALDDWRRGVFSDVARGLAVRVASGGAGDATPDEARRRATAMTGTVALAGMRPGELYGPRHVVETAGPAGPEWVAAYLGRYAALNHPLLAAAALASLFLAGAFLALVLHVSWWRYELATSRRFYQAERAARARREGMGDPGSGAP